MEVNVCLRRDTGHNSMQLLPLKPPEERWACSALFSCAAQLHTHHQFGAAITLFTAALDAAASGLVRQEDNTQTVQACTLSRASVNTRVPLHQTLLHQVLQQVCTTCFGYKQHAFLQHRFLHLGVL